LLARLGDAVVPARHEDMAGVRSLLANTELAYVELDDHLDDLLIVRDEERAVVGCVAMELYDEAGLLRALATSTERRGEGLGWMLADAALGRARVRGCRRVYLITESASDFFAEKFGFRAVQLSMVDAAVAESSQFRTASPNATAMVLDLPIDG
jgi:N-acetylglutamate synthase-like GNAT family acetyltransferase